MVSINVLHHSDETQQHTEFLLGPASGRLFGSLVCLTPALPQTTPHLAGKVVVQSTEVLPPPPQPRW